MCEQEQCGTPPVGILPHVNTVDFKDGVADAEPGLVCGAPWENGLDPHGIVTSKHEAKAAIISVNGQLPGWRKHA